MIVGPLLFHIREGILVERRSPTTPRRSYGSKRISKAAESSASSSDATNTNASLPFRSYPAPSGPGTTVVSGSREQAAGLPVPVPPRAISRWKWSALGGASSMNRKVRCTGVIGIRKRTWPRRPKHSL